MIDNRHPIVGRVYRPAKSGRRRLVTAVGRQRELGATIPSGGYNVIYRGETKHGWGLERVCYVSTWLEWASSNEPEVAEA